MSRQTVFRHIVRSCCFLTRAQPPVNMTVKEADEGETWTIAKTIHPGPSAYSCLVRLPDGTIGLLFEGGIDGPYEYIYFTRFTIDWLLDEVQTP